MIKQKIPGNFKLTVKFVLCFQDQKIGDHQYSQLQGD